MRLICIMLVLFSLLGCGSNPIRFSGTATKTEDQLFDFISARYLNKRAPNNKYLVVVRGQNSTFEGKRCDVNKLDLESKKIEDPYVENDLRETIKLAVMKGYTAFESDSDSDLESFFDKLVKLSDDRTQLIVAMSGECDDKGFIINLVHAGAANLVPPDKKLLADKIIAHLGLIKGVKAVIVNGCQSGCFVDAARKDEDFKGVVIAACPVGYATTQCNRTGTSALYAGFLGLYRNEPQAVKNLAVESISAGFWFENIRHKISDIGAGGLPISYNPVIYSTAAFPF